MKELVASITMNKAVGFTLGAVLMATCGLASFAEAMPTVGITAHERLDIVSQHGVAPGAAILRLVDTRDHDEDASADRPTAQMNSQKKQMDQSKKRAPGSKSSSGQGQGTDQHNSAKRNQSVTPDQQDKEGDRPDDRRQGGNIERKP